MVPVGEVTGNITWEGWKSLWTVVVNRKEREDLSGEDPFVNLRRSVVNLFKFRIFFFLLE